jgi:deoxycytidine triphosphate deaminase
LNNPEGASVDLRLGSIHKIVGGDAFIEADGAAGQGLRSGFETDQIYTYKEDSDTQDTIIVNPGEYFLIKTIETVDIPTNVLADFRARSSLFRAGLSLLTTIGSPGYKGELIFGLHNAGQHPVTLQMGARISQAIFYRLESEGVAYRGQNQGGRVTSAGIEQQV